MSGGRFAGVLDEALSLAIAVVAFVAASVAWLLIMLQCLIVGLVALVLLPIVLAARALGLRLPDCDSFWRGLEG